MLKSLVAALVLLSLVSCSATKVTDPVLSKPQAQGTPLEGDPGEGGGGPPPMTFDATANGSTVAVTLNGFDASGAFGFQFTFTLSGGLALNPGNMSAVSAGTWLTSTPNYVCIASQNSDGSITVVGTRWVGGGYCAHAGGQLATISTTGSGTFTLVGSPSGAVTPSPTLKDCSNADLPIYYGNASVGL